MRKIITLVFLLFSFFLVSCGRGMVTSQGIEQGLTISAQGEAKAAPDQIQVVFSLGSLKATVEEALLTLESKHKSVIDILREAGIEIEDLKMTGYTLMTERYWNESTRSQVITGYRSNKDFSLNLDFNEEMVGKVYDTFSRIPSDKTTFFSFNVLFGLKDPSTLEQEALATAITKAKVDAEFIAHSAGVRLLGITSITPDQVMARPVVYHKEMMVSAPAMTVDGFLAGPVPIKADEIKVSRNVVIVWRLLF